MKQILLVLYFAILTINMKKKQTKLIVPNSLKKILGIVFNEIEKQCYLLDSDNQKLN